MGILSIMLRHLLKLLLGSPRRPPTNTESSDPAETDHQVTSPLIFESELDRIRDETRAARTESVETGGVLFGTRTPDDELLIYRATGPGPNADHHEVHFSPDTDHAQQLLDRIRRDKDVVWIGTWHKHPGQMNSLSGGDVSQMREFVQDPELLDEMIAIIVTHQGSDVTVDGFYMDETLSPVRTDIEVVPEADEAEYRAYCNYDDSTTTDDNDDSGLFNRSAPATESFDDYHEARLGEPLSTDQQVPTEDDSSPTQSDQPVNPRPSPERGDDPADGEQPNPLQERVVQEYETLQSTDAVREVTLRRNEDDEDRSFLIRVVPRHSTPLVFVCSDGFPEQPPVVAREDADRYELLDGFPREWSPHRSLDDVIRTILDGEAVDSEE